MISYGPAYLNGEKNPVFSLISQINRHIFTFLCASKIVGDVGIQPFRLVVKLNI